MKIAGIIAEYNPFHNGHKYHIEKTREITGADGIVAVMSGNFVQRGDAAICDKFARAEMTLHGGADLVVELPCVFACSSAEIFARGGVGLLESLGCDCISFGIEDENIDELKKVALYLKNSDENFKNRLNSVMKTGKSYPRALAEVLGTDVIDTPNNVLAIEYLKALETMEPFGIKRSGSMHDGEGSASDIRRKIQLGEDANHLMPDYSKNILKSAHRADKRVLESLALYKLRTIGEEELENVPDVTEGLENRIIDAAKKAESLEELCELIKTKRYTMARIRRIIINSLIGIKKEDVLQKPQYIRVLGMNKRGMKILSDLRDKTDIPIITKTADAKSCRMLELDIVASDVYSVLCGERGGRDFLTPPIILNE